MKSNEAATPQPPPQANERPHIADLVIEDIRARKAEGVRKYGTPLQAGNGRDALMDAYQEVLDLAQYLKQEMEERRDREGNVKHEQDTQVPFVEVAAEAIHEARVDQTNTRSDEAVGRVSEVQAQAHCSFVVDEREESRRREAARRFADTMSAMSSAETLKAIKASQDKLRREGAVAALEYIIKYWWGSEGKRATWPGPSLAANLAARIEAGEVKPWAK